MILFLSSADQLAAAKKALTALGLEHSFHASESPFFEVKTASSVLSEEQIKKELSRFGKIAGNSASKTPLLDELKNEYSVDVPCASAQNGMLRFQSNPKQPIWIAGPCALETPETLHLVAKSLSALGIKVLRGGALKPRTSPHDFQGVGQNGYRWLAETAHQHGMVAISEALSETDVESAFEYLDIVQIGARNMQNFALLKKIAEGRKPVILKRGPGATLKEWALAAEYLLKGGNSQVILCERGVRGLEKELRYTLDFAGAAWMQMRFHLPVVIDPSHATGSKALLPACTAATLAMGFAGVMLETHPEPVESKSDSLQALRLEEFREIYSRFQS